MPFGRRRAFGKMLGFAGVRRGPVCFALVHPEFAMAIVAVYQFRAKFRSQSDSLDAPPKLGLSRAGLLLLKQEQDVRSDADAIAACIRHGAFDAVINAYGVIEPAKVLSPQNRDFMPLYEAALVQGSALSYDPNSAPSEEAPHATQWGFRPDDRR